MYKHVIGPISRIIFLCSITVLLYFSIAFSIGYVYPFLIAFIIAAMLKTPVTYLEKNWKLPRPVATLFVILLLVFLFIGIVFLVVNEVIQGIAYLMEKFQGSLEQFIQLLETILLETIIPVFQKLTSIFQNLEPSQQSTIQENLQAFLENIATSLTMFLQSIIIQLPDIIGFFPSSLTVMIFILIATFLIINDWEHLVRHVSKFLPTHLISFAIDLQSGLKKGFTGYIRAQLILIFISSVIIFIGLFIIGVEHALTIAVIAAIVDLLPLFGTGLIFIPWIIYSFIVGNYSLTIGLTIIYMIVIITRQFIEPKVLSASIGVNPLVSLFVLFITIQLWGVAGVIFSPILLIIIYVLYETGIVIKVFQFIKG